MKKHFALLPLLLAALTFSGCSALQVEATFRDPDAVTATARPQLTATPVGVENPTDWPTLTPLPADTTAPATTQPTDTPLPATATPQPTTANQSDIEAAVQTMLNYFDAINAPNLPQAYRYWQGEGSASGQTYGQYAQGFADTVRVSVQVAAPGPQENAGAHSVTVPVTLTAVANVPNGPPPGQRFQVYQGTYTLQPGGPAAPDGSAWHIASASITEVTGSTQPPADLSDPSAVIQAYADAINRREYARAYTYWDNLGGVSQQTFAQFEQGFATTSHVAFQVGDVQSEGAAGSIYATVQVIIVAEQSDQTTQTYSGTYTLRRANVPPFDQFGWRIERGEMVLR